MRLALLLLCLSPARAEVFDRVVAQIQQQLVLASEVHLEAALEERDRDALPFWTARHADATGRLVDASVVRVAAGDIGLYQPEEAEVAARLEAVRGTFVDRTEWESFLSQHGLDEAALGRVLRRRLMVERFLRRNVTADLADEAKWLEECQGLLVQLRGRIRIRQVPLMETSP